MVVAKIAKTGNSYIISIKKVFPDWQPGDKLQISHLTKNVALVTNSSRPSTGGEIKIPFDKYDGAWLSKFNTAYKDPNINKISVALPEGRAEHRLPKFLDSHYDLDVYPAYVDGHTEFICKLHEVSESYYNSIEKILSTPEHIIKTSIGFLRGELNEDCCQTLKINMGSLEKTIVKLHNILERRIRKPENFHEFNKYLLSLELIGKYEQVGNCFSRVCDAVTDLRKNGLKKVPAILEACRERAKPLEQALKCEPEPAATTLICDANSDELLIKSHPHTAKLREILSSTREIVKLSGSITEIRYLLKA